MVLNLYKKKMIFKKSYMTSTSSNGSTSNLLHEIKIYWFHDIVTFYNNYLENYYIYECFYNNSLENYYIDKSFKINIHKIPFFNKRHLNSILYTYVLLRNIFNLLQSNLFRN